MMPLCGGLNPLLTCDDLRQPDKGPLPAPARRCDATWVGRSILIKSARLLPAAVILDLTDAAAIRDAKWPDRLIDLNAAKPNLPPQPLASCSHARLPMKVSEAGRLHIYPAPIWREKSMYGHRNRAAPTVANRYWQRLHSACFTATIMGSLKCLIADPQLHAAMAQWGPKETAYCCIMNQEGRGHWADQQDARLFPSTIRDLNTVEATPSWV